MRNVSLREGRSINIYIYVGDIGGRHRRGQIRKEGEDGTITSLRAQKG